MNQDFNEKKYNKIAYRIDTIQEMIKGKNVDSIIDYNTNSEEIDSVNSEDIRTLLPKIFRF